MKKLIYIIAFIFILFPALVESKTIRVKTFAQLQGIDGQSLSDGDAAFIITLQDDATYPSQSYNCILDADSAAAESLPTTVSPDTNAGNKRWLCERLDTGGDATMSSAIDTDNVLICTDGTSGKVVQQCNADSTIPGNITINPGVIFLQEQADADADVAGQGQIWINTATPNELWFTDDSGTDVQLGVGGAFDSTTVDATTWSDGANASNTWTFDVSGTDHTMIFGNGIVTFSHDVTVDDQLAIGVATADAAHQLHIESSSHANLKFETTGGSSRANMKLINPNVEFQLRLDFDNKLKIYSNDSTTAPLIFESCAINDCEGMMTFGSDENITFGEGGANEEITINTLDLYWKNIDTSRDLNECDPFSQLSGLLSGQTHFCTVLDQQTITGTALDNSLSIVRMYDTLVDMTSLSASRDIEAMRVYISTEQHGVDYSNLDMKGLSVIANHLGNNATSDIGSLTALQGETGSDGLTNVTMSLLQGTSMSLSYGNADVTTNIQGYNVNFGNTASNSVGGYIAGFACNGFASGDTGYCLYSNDPDMIGLYIATSAGNTQMHFNAATSDTPTSSPETDAEQGWLEINVAGSTRYIPFYN